MCAPGRNPLFPTSRSLPRTEPPALRRLSPSATWVPFWPLGPATTSNERSSNVSHPSANLTPAHRHHSVEFYFDDANLPYDKFMWKLHSQNEEHWIPIATIASFKRMREFAARGAAWVADALRRGSAELEVDAAGENVRRRTEVRPPKGQFERSVYAVRAVVRFFLFFCFSGAR